MSTSSNFCDLVKGASSLDTGGGRFLGRTLDELAIGCLGAEEPGAERFEGAREVGVSCEIPFVLADFLPAPFLLVFSKGPSSAISSSTLASQSDSVKSEGPD